MAVLVFFSAAAGTRIISSNLGPYFNGFLFNRCWIIIVIFICCIIAACRFHLGFVCTHTAHVGFLFTTFAYLLRLALLHRYISVTKEIYNVFIDAGIHLLEQHISLLLVN